MFKEACLKEMALNGLPFDGPLVADGQIHRYSCDNKKNQPDEWYTAYSGVSPKGNAYLHCMYGSWSQGPKFEYRSWETSSNTGTQLTAEERRHLQEETKKRSQDLLKEQERKHRETAEKASQLWKQSSESGNHPYLTKKLVQAFGIRFGQYVNDDAMIIPLRNVEGEMKSLQFIYKAPEEEKCQKRFLSGGEKLANFHVIGQLNPEKELAVCEGYATGASWHMGTGMTTVIAFDSGNLKPVIGALKSKYPALSVLIVADDDVGTSTNTGRAKALDAAYLYNCRVIFPQFPSKENSSEEKGLTDFNDVHVAYGLEEVKHQWTLFQGSEQKPNLAREARSTRKDLEQRIEQTEDFDELTGPICESLAFASLKPADKELLLRLISKKAGLSVSSLRSSEKMLRKPGVQERKNHLEIAEEIITNFGKENLLCDQSSRIWKWQTSGVWKVIDDKEMKQVIHKACHGMNVNKSLVNSILDLIATTIFRPEHRFDVDTRTINCLNGEIELKEGSWHLGEHRREDYRTAQIPIIYDPEAKAPRFEQFLQEIFEGDHDSEDKQILVCELLGYTLMSSSEFEKFVLLLGHGANGKSVLLHVVQSLIGIENTSAVQLSQLDNRFQRAHLQGKLANIITEIAEGCEIPDAQLKAIVSGERMTAEHKHKSPFDFSPFCTCWFGSNHMPYTKDFSDAIFRRALIITFNQKFEGSRKDLHLKEALVKELPGILNLALEAFASVVSRKEFTEPSSSIEAKERWRKECDQVAMFIEECCELEAGSQSTSKEIYQAYVYWANELGIKRSLNQNSLTRRLSKFGVTLHKGKQGIRKLNGIRIMPILKPTGGAGGAF